MAGRQAGGISAGHDQRSESGLVNFRTKFLAPFGCLVAMLLEGRQRLDTLHALELSQNLISAQLADASSYVRSQLPANLSDSVRTDWRYMPSSALGGDALACF